MGGSTGSLTYIPKGDITNPDISKGKANILLHCCNDIPTMGGGVAKALYTKWPQVREQYMLWKHLTTYGHHTEEEAGEGNHAEKYQYHFPNPGIRQFALGNVQLIAGELEDDKDDKDEQVLIANMIGQHDICSNNIGVPPVRYSAFILAFNLLSEMAAESEVEICIHIPYLMGCDLAGGTWDLVEMLINKHFVNNDIEVKVYDLFEKHI